MTDAAKPPVLVTVQHNFPVVSERVFDAWLDPAMIGTWMMGRGVRDEDLLHAKIDARVGGRFSFLVRRQGQEIDHIGTYLEIDRPRRLVFTWGTVQDGATSRVIIDIAATPGGCALTLTHEMDAAWAPMQDRIRDSWAKMLGSLGTALA